MELPRTRISRSPHQKRTLGTSSVCQRVQNRRPSSFPVGVSLRNNLSHRVTVHSGDRWESVGHVQECSIPAPHSGCRNNGLYDSLLPHRSPLFAETFCICPVVLGLYGADPRLLTSLACAGCYTVNERLGTRALSASLMFTG